MSAILFTTVISAKALEDEYHNLGCQGDIVIYEDERTRLYSPFDESFKDRSSWDVRHMYDNYYDDYHVTGTGTYGGLEVVIPTDGSGFKSIYIRSTKTTENLPYKLQVHCYAGTTYLSGRTVKWECYWNVTVKKRERIVITASPEGGKVLKGTKVYLKASKSDAKIYYTTNGSIPWEKSPVYTSSGL